MRAVGAHDFGGGFALGAVQAGFEFSGKMSRKAGFGVHSTLVNRHLLGNDWDSYLGKPHQWPIINADLVFGNPPCSGFSTLSSASFRGMDSPINDLMWETIDYASRVAPPIVIFESVQQTFRQGLPLMRKLHDFLCNETGFKYKLIHVLHNNASVGGVSDRKRYFWVASRVPFGIESIGVTPAGQEYEVKVASTLGRALYDLEPLGLTMERQSYPSAVHYETGRTLVRHSSDWARQEMHDGSGSVDGHDILRSPMMLRAADLVNEGKIRWPEGANQQLVISRYYDWYGRIPASYDYPTKVPDLPVMPRSKRLIDTDFNMGHNQLTRWYWDRPAYVITGGGGHLFMHPNHFRTFTMREVARIQGFPDAWKIWPVRRAPDLGPGWGKGVPVQAGRWIAHFAARAIAGQPGSNVGVPLNVWSEEHTHLYLRNPKGEIIETLESQEDETVIDITNDWRAKPLVNEYGKEVTPWPYEVASKNVEEEYWPDDPKWLACSIDAQPSEREMERRKEIYGEVNVKEWFASREVYKRLSGRTA